MTEQQEFEAWWDQDCDTSENPYSQHSMMYWAWEAWKAGRKAEREVCAKEAENRWLNKANCSAEEMYELQKKVIAEAIRARGQG